MTYTETLVDLSVLQNLLTSEFSSVKTKKSVSFCRQLEKVRYFRTEDPVLNIRTQQEQAKTHLPQYLMRSPVASRYLSSELLASQVRDRCVVLEYVVLRYPFFEGYVSVKNLSFQKRVVIRYTIDNWRSTHEVVARFDSSNHSTNADRFVFTIDATPFFSGPVDPMMLFAVRYESAGQELWDNNAGLNYRADFVKLPAPISAFAPSALSSSKPSTSVPPSPTSLVYSTSPSSTSCSPNSSSTTSVSLSSSPNSSSPFSRAMSPLAMSAAAVVAQLEAEPAKLMMISRTPSTGSYIMSFDTKSPGASSSSSSASSASPVSALSSSPSSFSSPASFSTSPSSASLLSSSPSSTATTASTTTTPTPSPTTTTTSSHHHRSMPASQPINITKVRVQTNPCWWADVASSSSSSSSPSASITSASSAPSSSSSSPPKSDLGHAYLTVSLAHNSSSFWQ